MTDRDLLELAAKAAGIDFEYDSPTHCGYFSEWNGLPQWNKWNPLEIDGDALRLAVKLNLSVCVELDQTWIASKGYPTTPLCFVNHDGDPYAATRRAIVCAAAEIGKQMGDSDD